MIVGRWYVQLAALWPSSLPLCIYIIFFNFILRLSILLFFFNLVFNREIRRNGRRYQHVLALCALLAGVILKGVTIRKYVSDV